MLNKELSHFAENNKSGAQISDYLYSTYTGKLKFFFMLIAYKAQTRYINMFALF